MNMVALGLCLSFAITAQTQRPDRDAASELRTRAEEYARAVEFGRYDLVWDRSSKRVHDEIGNDREAFIEHLRLQASAGLRVEVRFAKIEGDEGWVVMSISERDARGEPKTGLYESTWVREHGTWVLDSMDGPYDESEYMRPEAPYQVLPN